MRELPQGWTEPYLGEVAEVVGGKTPKGLAEAPPGSIPFFKVGDMNAAEGMSMIAARTHLDSSAVASLKLRLWPVGTIVFPKQGGAIATNKKRVLGVEGVCDLNTMGVIPCDGVMSKFLLHWFETFNLASLSDGTVVAQIKPSKVADLRIPLPPLNEQRRIVTAIEEQFSRLDAADDSMMRAKRRLDAFRGSVLSHGVEGSWPTEPLSSLLMSLRNGLFVSRPAAAPPGTAIFRISAVRPLKLDVEDVRYAPVAVEECADYLVAEGDLLFTRYSGNPEYVGACARVPDLPRPTLHPDKLIRGIVNRDKAEPAFIELACATGSTREEIRTRRKTTAGQVGIAGGQLKSVPIPVPPLEEQRRIVSEVDQQLSNIQAVREAIEAANRRSAALRRLILVRAFRGDLVPQDPSDESAAILLDRIRAERDAIPTKLHRRRVQV